MTTRRVIKVGGSCLSSPELPQRLAQLLRSNSDSQNLLIVGGGMCIDAMRDLDQRFELDQTRMHWRCVTLLRSSFEVLCELVPSLHPIATPSQFQTLLTTPPVAENHLIAVDTFYHPLSSDHSRLPVGWETTTDSIAAYLAKLSGAEELLLLKSCNMETANIQQLADVGFLDAAFPGAAPANINLKIINLTGPPIV